MTVEFDVPEQVPWTVLELWLGVDVVAHLRRDVTDVQRWDDDGGAPCQGERS